MFVCCANVPTHVRHTVCLVDSEQQEFCPTRWHFQVEQLDICKGTAVKSRSLSDTHTHITIIIICLQNWWEGTDTLKISPVQWKIKWNPKLLLVSRTLYQQCWLSAAKWCFMMLYHNNSLLLTLAWAADKHKSGCPLLPRPVLSHSVVCLDHSGTSLILSTL